MMWFISGATRSKQPSLGGWSADGPGYTVPWCIVTWIKPPQIGELGAVSLLCSNVLPHQQQHSYGAPMSSWWLYRVSGCFCGTSRCIYPKACQQVYKLPDRCTAEENSVEITGGSPTSSCYMTSGWLGRGSPLILPYIATAIGDYSILIQTRSEVECGSGHWTS